MQLFDEQSGRHIGIGWGDTMANGRHNGRGRGDTMANRYWGHTMERGDTMARNIHLHIE